MSDFILLLF